MCRDEASKGPLEVTSTKVLGIEWWPTEDVFCFRFDFPEKPTTKRGILSVIASFYDPIGYVAPVLLPARVALQRICRAKFGWDDELGEEGRQWIQWKENMRKMNPLLVPRGVEPAALKGVEIHSFCDASEMGYGAVVYMMITGSKPCVRLLFAKSRVASLKVVTIPRLELSAATLAVRITKKVKEIYHLENVPTSYWTDSLIVLYYIQNESKRFSTFVVNRLTTIHCLSLARQWNHVPSRDNPADLISRGITCNNQLTKCVEGPDFLRNNGFHPNEQVIITELPNGVELKSCKVQLHSITERRFFEDRFANISDWHLLLRRLAWLVRFKQYFTIMRRGHPSDSLRVGPLTNVEMQLAERDLIRQVQAHHLDESRDGVKRLNPLFLDGLYRVGGRSYGENGPLILPRGHWTAERIMLYYHKRECHAGPIHVASCVRERFWIVGGLALAKRISRRCLICRVQLARSQGQQLSELPAIRHTPGMTQPFSYVGLDFFGPFSVRVRRSNEKRYACIMTCLQVRAVHIEITRDLTTDSFILALMRFIARRGLPITIISDNGTNLVGAASELKSAIDALSQSTISSKLSYRGIQWKFQPPHASHRGGIWERMIRSVRRIINSVANLSTLSDEKLSTLMCEAERVLNNRPLTSLPTDPADPKPLTPNHLLNIRSGDELALAPLTSHRCRRQWQHVNHLSDVFWKRWVREYLPTLQYRQRWILKKRELEEGDLVLVGDAPRPRNAWLLGTVVEPIKSADGLVRTVRVRTKEGEVTRDVRKIYLVEAVDEPRGEGSSNQTDDT